MSDPIRCAECEAILDELRSVTGIPTMEQARAARETTLKVILSTDDEALDELLEKHPFRVQSGGPVQAPQYSKMAAAYRRLFTHRARTGHSPRLWP